MTIALDYDDTFTRDPTFWREFVSLLKLHGHQCVLVTGRQHGTAMAEQVKADIGELMPMVFSGKLWKREAANKNGCNPDIWIDDSPEYVGPQMLVGK